MEWTKEQKQAIYEKGNNILVAAAAGSGAGGNRQAGRLRLAVCA